MTTVMLVDDEQPVLDGISSVIGRFMPGLKVAGTAKNGREAIDKALDLKPDILLIDVKMPGLNGIEVLKELRRLRLEPLSILLTAYERFDVAQSAFELGVFDYLVKPMNQERLIEVLGQAKARIEERSEGRRETISYREQIEGLKPFLEEIFFEDSLMGGGRRAATCYEKLGFSSDSGVAAAAGLPAGIPRAEAESLAEAIRSALSFHHRCIVGAPAMSAVPVFMPLPPGEDMPKFFHGLKRLVFELEPLGLGLAAGDRCMARGELEALWPGLALASRRARPGELLLAAGEAGAGKADGAADEAIFSLDPGVVEAALAGQFRSILAAEGPEAARRWAIGAISAALAAAERKLPGPGDRALQALFAKDCAIGEGDHGMRIEEAFREALGELAKRKRLVAERPRSRQVAEAMAYLNANFAKPVSLEGLAEIVDARPSALSRLFQEETGKSFMEYLITLRIEFAKRELSAGGKSVKEIATASGYPDANYFSRLFKKETGLTPSEFTQQGGKEP